MNTTLLKNKSNSNLLKIIAFTVLFVSCIMFLVACGKTPKHEAKVYNTKNMSDTEIVTYFSDKVLQDVKNDSRHRSIVVMDIDDSISKDTTIKWNLILNNEVILNDLSANIYVDEDKPENNVRRTVIMIGWDEADLDKTWTVEIYYMNGTEKVVLDDVSFLVSSSEYTKAE